MSHFFDDKAYCLVENSSVTEEMINECKRFFSVTGNKDDNSLVKDSTHTVMKFKASQIPDVFKGYRLYNTCEIVDLMGQWDSQ